MKGDTPSHRVRDRTSKVDRGTLTELAGEQLVADLCPQKQSNDGSSPQARGRACVCTPPVLDFLHTTMWSHGVGVHEERRLPRMTPQCTCGSIALEIGRGGLWGWVMTCGKGHQMRIKTQNKNQACSWGGLDGEGGGRCVALLGVLVTQRGLPCTHTYPEPGRTSRLLTVALVSLG